MIKKAVIILLFFVGMTFSYFSYNKGFNECDKKFNEYKDKYNNHKSVLIIKKQELDNQILRKKIKEQNFEINRLMNYNKICQYKIEDLKKK